MNAHPRFAIATPTARGGAQSERRSGCTGLPVIPDNTMTAADRDALRRVERASRLLADRIAEALEDNRADLALEALQAGGDLANLAALVATRIGTGR